MSSALPASRLLHPALVPNRRQASSARQATICSSRSASAGLPGGGARLGSFRKFGARRLLQRAVPQGTTPPRPDPAALDDAFCNAPYVEVANSADGVPSVLTIEVGDFPGLLRLIAWSLNGLDVRIVRAKLSNKDGIANDTFWVTELDGKQIRDPDALRDRLIDILTSCISAEREAQDGGPIFTAGPVTVDNGHDDGTLVSLEATPGKNSELLEVASLLSGLNMNVEEAEICNEVLEECSLDAGYGTWRFKITRKGKKLDNTQAASLAFALLVATNKKHAMMETPI